MKLDEQIKLKLAEKLGVRIIKLISEVSDEYDLLPEEMNDISLMSLKNVITTFQMVFGKK